MNFGQIKTWIVLGGGQMFSEFCLKLIGQGFEVLVVTSKRHAKEFILSPNKDEMTLREFCRVSRLPCIVSDDVNNDDGVIRLIKDDAMGISFGAAWIFSA